MLLASSSLIISDRRQETRGQPRLSRYSRTVGPVVRENAVMHTPWWRGSVGLKAYASRLSGLLYSPTH